MRGSRSPAVEENAREIDQLEADQDSEIPLFFTIIIVIACTAAVGTKAIASIGRITRTSYSAPISPRLLSHHLRAIGMGSMPFWVHHAGSLPCA